MSISIACSACGKLYKLDDRFAGKRVKCNRCGSTFSVSAEAAPTPDETTASVDPGATAEPGFPVGGGRVQAGVAQASAAEFEPPTRPSAEQSEAAEFESGTQGDGFADAATEAGGAGSSSQPEDEPLDEPLGGLVGGGVAAGRSVVEERVAVDPAAAAARYPQSTMRDRSENRPPDQRPPFRPVAAASISPSPGSNASPTPAAHRPLSNLISLGLYAIGAVVEVLGWAQVMAFEQYNRRIERVNDEAVSLRLIRSEVRGGIYVIGGLLILVLAALVHLRGAVREQRPAQT